ncbi:hypothetical protein H70357_26335 [Paenibacillus sp. FSL H7-0357]|uniref:helix-turn-helix domain-containing protein n=1 Tax=Paenibacillus sp. FSL H7-0357 TaxID=1536774 RepID=UPI0004F6CC61|nr:hypothetical protein H70357_26335 [Paenibacillus sp. FSL H7-0357]
MSSPFVPVQARSSILNLPGKYNEWRPSVKLHKYVYCYWLSTIRSSQDSQSPISISGRKEMIAPDGCIDIVFQIGKDRATLHGMIVGTLDRSLYVDLAYDRLHTFGIRFYPGGLQAFLREPADLFTNQILDLSEIWKQLQTELTGHLQTAASMEHFILLTDRSLLSRLNDSPAGDDLFQNALVHIWQAQGILTVKELARRECVSERQLRRIFYERTGVSTKTFTRIMRFQSVLGMLNRMEGRKLTDAALQTGYYDQAHFIHEFQSICGLLPSEYIKSLN